MNERGNSANNEAICAALVELEFVPQEIAPGTKILVQSDGGGIVEIEYLEEEK